MSVIDREDDGFGGPAGIYRQTLKTLANKLFDEQVLIFLGAGASNYRVDGRGNGHPANGQGDLTPAEGLAEAIARGGGLIYNKLIPLSTYAFLYESRSSRDVLNNFIKEQIDKLGLEPSPAIRRLVEFISILESRDKKILVVTTNYDEQFERAYQAAMGRLPEVVIYNGGLDPKEEPRARFHLGIDEAAVAEPKSWKPEGRTCLYKMHGCISKADGQNLVVTEEDYVNFLTKNMGQDEKQKLLPHVTAQIADSTILFIGYGLSDWNFRVIFKAVKEHAPKASYAVLYHDSASMDASQNARWIAQTRFWDGKKVSTINADTSRFMEDLLNVV